MQPFNKSTVSKGFWEEVSNNKMIYRKSDGIKLDQENNCTSQTAIKLDSSLQIQIYKVMMMMNKQKEGRHIYRWKISLV